jgi:hypothetical protein
MNAGINSHQLEIKAKGDTSARLLAIIAHIIRIYNERSCDIMAFSYI